MITAECRVGGIDKQRVLFRCALLLLCIAKLFLCATIITSNCRNSLVPAYVCLCTYIDVHVSTFSIYIYHINVCLHTSIHTRARAHTHTPEQEFSGFSDGKEFDATVCRASGKGRRNPSYFFLSYPHRILRTAASCTPHDRV